MAGSAFGVTGLAVMGRNVARNVARHGIPVAIHNRTDAKTRDLIEHFGDEGSFTATESVADFVAALDRPRKILIMVKAGAPVDGVLDELVPLLDRGDIVIDGGNSRFTDTQRRVRDVGDQGVHFLGVGISGGEEGALLGPSIMPGGDRGAYGEVEQTLTTIAAQVDGTPCCVYVGPDGAGHYVKMVHNGIEYADIQLIAEAYDLLRHGAGLETGDIAGTFDDWNRGDLDSFLVETTATVLGKVDHATGRPLVDMIVDQAEQKGTGRWTAQDALELGVPLTAITEAVFARTLSALRDERGAAAKILTGPTPEAPASGAGATGDGFVDDVRRALYASKVVAYAQGFAQMRAAAEAQSWPLDLGAMATIWRGGCIIRARFLDRIKDAYADHGDVTNLLVVPYFADAVGEAQDSWRRVVTRAIDLGIPTPAFSSALAYYDGYRRARGPASIVQGLRDFFGAHTYQRIDKPGTFHTHWEDQDAPEVETSAERTSPSAITHPPGSDAAV